MTNVSDHIRSFVRRQGKITAGQRRAREELSSRYCLAVGNERIDLVAAFGRSAPTVLEIGFGMGETTAAIAAMQPDVNFLGLEIYPAGVGSLLTRLSSQAITNVRILEQDAVEVIRHRLGAHSLQGVHLYFPDPWPKKRHHKRRLIQPEFVASLVQVLAPGGYFHAATDWPDYAAQMLEVLDAEPALENAAGPGLFHARPETRPLTKFEARGLRLGNPVADLIYRRRDLSSQSGQVGL